MKKLFAILAFSAFFVACDSAADATEEVTNTVEETANDAVDAVQNTADSAAAAIDSTADAVIDSMTTE